MEQTFGYISLCLAVLGIFLVFLFTPMQKYQEKSIAGIYEDCEGFVRFNGILVKTFYSKKGNYIGIVSEADATLMVLVNNNTFLENDKVSVYGTASEYSGACWVFPEKVEFA